MIAREWKTRCPEQFKESFIQYLYQTGVSDASKTPGFKELKILSRTLGEHAEIILVTYWDCYDSIKAFAGEDISIAKLYPEDGRYHIDPDTHVTHYEVVESIK